MSKKRKVSVESRKKDLVRLLGERPRHYLELAKELGTSRSWVKRELLEMQQQHFPIEYIPDPKNNSRRLWFIPSSTRPGLVFTRGEYGYAVDTYRVGMISDTHFGSKHHDNDALCGALELFVNEGVSEVYHAGDVLDGVGVYRGQEMEVTAWGLEDQAEIAIKTFENFPGIMFYAILGNHDYSFVKRAKVNPNKYIQAECSNFVDLGDLKADVLLSGARFRLIHGAGGNCYALTYPSQKYLRNIAQAGVGEVPDVLLIGHYHFAGAFHHMGCHVVHPSSFQRSVSEFCVRKGLTGPVGGYLVELDVQAGRVVRFRPEFHEF